MDARKAELVDRLNAIQQRIQEQGLWCDPKLEQMRQKILQELDLYSDWKKDDKPRGNRMMSWIRSTIHRL